MAQAGRTAETGVIYVDTNVLIDALRGHAPAVQFLQQLGIAVHTKNVKHLSAIPGVSVVQPYP